MALASHWLLQPWTSTAVSTIAAFRLSPIPISSKSRSNAAVKLPISQKQKRKLSIVLASNPSGGNSVEKRSDGDEAPRGPPLLTILAGVAVFFTIFWIAKSIILGLIGFFVSLFPFK